MIVIKPTGGLCNYLRVVLSYYEYAKSINQKLIVIWKKTDACNGYFLNYFEPIPNIIFTRNITSEKNINYIGYSNHPDFTPNYKYLKLRPYIKQSIKERINILEKNYIAVHIRRTDHIYMAQLNNSYTHDDDFYSFLDKFGNKNIYIATDNESTYNEFKQKHKNQVKLEYHNTDKNVLRHTSLQDAIIDMYMCIYSEHFMGSGFSSFSDTINSLRQINGENPVL
jgi:hypothetical protein